VVTPGELDELVGHCPYLYHMAMKDSWASIQKNGLLPTNDLLDLFDVDEVQRQSLTSKRRPHSVEINHPTHGMAIVRDQIPLYDADLQKCLTGGLTPEDWHERLNERVFFWLTEERLKRLMCAGAYRKLEHLILKVPTQAIIENYRDSIELSPMNSGCTKPMPHPRGPDTFLSIDNYPYDFWKKVRRRKAGERVVELTVIGGIPDISKYVVQASIRSCNGLTTVIYEA
jgi:hypothetical protein